jgi:hypothetical protein
MNLPLIAECENIHLESKTFEAVFSKETGALLRLTNTKTGWNIQARSTLGLSFKMLVPLPDRKNNQVLGENQTLSDYHVDSDGQGVTLTWTDCQSEHGGILPITFTGRISISDDGLSFKAELENLSAYVIEAVSWPYIGDFSMPPMSSELNRMNLVVHGDMEVKSLRPNFPTGHGYFATNNPIQTVPTPTSPFALTGSSEEGLYAGYHDTSAEQLVMFTWELKPGYEQSEEWRSGTVPRTEEIGGQVVRIEFYTTHFPFLQPGKLGVLHPIVLQPYVGTWPDGADHYKKWRKKWFIPPPTPDWAKQVHSWQQIHINSPVDDLLCQYKDLIKYGEDCAKHGVTAIQLTGWTIGGQDRGNPSHDIEPRLGTREDLRDAISAIQDMGVRVILFNKYTWADMAHEQFRREYVSHAAKDPYGDYYTVAGFGYQTPTSLAEIDTRRIVPMCMSSPRYRTTASSEFRKSLALGADGLLYDECHHHGENYRYCFAHDHDHRVPSNMFSGDALLAEGFHQTASKQNPDFLFAGEDLYDLQFRHYSISYLRVGRGHVPLHRYIDPDAGMMMAVCGYDDRNSINIALLYRYIISYEPRNFKGRLDEFPKTLAYGKRVDALRKRHSAYLWEVEFLGPNGATVTSGKQPLKNYSVFLNHSSGKRAVVVANDDQDEYVQIHVTIGDSLNTMTLATPENPDPVKTDGTFGVPPLSAVVFMED